MGRITLSRREIILLAWVMDKVSEYMANDDRPDHGLGKLKDVRDIPSKGFFDNGIKREIHSLAGRLERIRFNWDVAKTTKEKGL